MRTTLTAGLFAALLAGGAADDLKKMQGTWSVTIAEVDGKPASAEDKNLKLTLVVEGDAFRVQLADKTVISAGTLKLDPSKTPPAMDATITAGPAKGAVQRAVYELKGDAMTAVFAKPGAERPRELKTRPDTGESLLRYTRAN